MKISGYSLYKKKIFVTMNNKANTIGTQGAATKTK